MSALITTIKRPHKHEAEIAIAELEKRGFTISYPLTEIKKVGTSSSAYRYTKGKYTNRQSNMTSVWVARLQKEGK